MIKTFLYCQKSCEICEMLRNVLPDIHTILYQIFLIRTELWHPVSSMSATLSVLTSAHPDHTRTETLCIVTHCHADTGITQSRPYYRTAKFANITAICLYNGM